jgi:hypothetical protein
MLLLLIIHLLPGGTGSADDPIGRYSSPECGKEKEGHRFAIANPFTSRLTVAAPYVSACLSRNKNGGTLTLATRRIDVNKSIFEPYKERPLTLAPDAFAGNETHRTKEKMIDLGTWNLSIPVGSPPATIETKQLIQGYDGKYFKSGSSNVSFWVPVTGSKTANAIYPRTELRETWSNGTLHNWYYPDADNFLRAKLKVIQVPSSGKIVIGQIHVYESTQPLLKVEYQYKDATHMGNIVAKVRFHPKDKKARVITIAEDVPLNETFNYVIHLNKAGLLSVTARGMVWNDRISATWSKQQLYFKAGVYCQDNTGYTSEGGKAMFFNLDTDHNKG